jgi:hypothetical protein
MLYKEIHAVFLRIARNTYIHGVDKIQLPVMLDRVRF